MTPEQVNKSIRQMRQMFAFIGGLMLLIALLTLFGAFSSQGDAAGTALLAVLYIGMTACFWTAFTNLGKRTPRGHTYAQISSAIFLLGFPILTIFGISYLIKLSKPQMKQALGVGTLTPRVGTDPLCPFCHHPNRVGARFCGKCGKTISAPGPAPKIVSPRANRDSRRWLWVAVGLVILIMGFAAYMFYRAGAENEYAAGVAAQQRDDCRTAQTHYRQVLDTYRFSLTQSLTDAQTNDSECQVVLSTDDALTRHDYDTVIGSYDSYRQQYPGGHSLEQMRQRVAQAHLQAADLARAGTQFELALSHYSVLVQNFADLPQRDQATKLVPATYMEWGLSLRHEGSFDKALEVYKRMKGDLVAGMTSDQYNRVRADTFLEWGNQQQEKRNFAGALNVYKMMQKELEGAEEAKLAHAASAAATDRWARAERTDGNFKSALEKYQALGKTYPDTIPAAGSKANAAETLLEWAKHEEQAGNSAAAQEKYGQLVEDFADTPSAAQAKPKVAGFLAAATQKLVSEKKFQQAIANYELLYKTYADSPEGAQAKTNAADTLVAWAESESNAKNYTHALELYERVTKDYAATAAFEKASRGINTLFNTAQTLVAQKEVCDSVPLFDTFSKRAQFANQAQATLPEALYKCGIAAFQNKNYTNARRMFNRILAEFSTGNYAARASAGLVDVQVADYRAQGAGELPPPQVSGATPDGTTVVVIRNDSPERLEILLSGPASQSHIVEPCPTCTKYSTIGPAFCPEKGPQKRITLSPGTYGVVVRSTSDSSVTPFYGSWDLMTGNEFTNCFFIVTTLR